ncbi:SMU1112c/YaeR family gloxylase I-like metalloprotein [Rossellomorea aquimaris]|uniref:SMU1112c/YaeR family gloxylase I-like metalloprotein n=1 Tax=Rossellomorea aquimaris TaxID=189382 RepID=UPI0007D04825|nr:VOC family protein [Rossellomorea aquimaris]
MNFKKIHHIAIICSDYDKSKEFYVHKLGLEVIREMYREERASYKLDLALNGEYIIELFSFPNSPKRPSYPEAQGLRHLAFEVEDVDQSVKQLNDVGIETEEVRVDTYTNKRFVFFEDPDGLPLEIYEVR